MATNLQIAHLSIILQFSGFESYIISYFWLIPPLIGLFIQPILGLISDNVRTRFGNRKPIFFISTLLGVVSVIYLPLAHDTLFIIFLIILLNIGINGSGQIARILILETIKEEDQTLAFSWATALGGLGAATAGILPWVVASIPNFSNQSAINGVLPRHIYFSFIIGAVCYLLTSLITLVMVKEKNRDMTEPIEVSNSTSLLLWKFICLSFKRFPAEFWKLSYVLFFAWTAMFAIWNYLHISIAQNLFHMPIHITDNIQLSAPYLAQANLWTSNYFGIMYITSTFVAFIIPYINNFITINRIFILGLGIGGLALTFIAFSTNNLLTIILMGLFGISWATITTCPYTIFSGMLPTSNKGYYMGIFNIIIVIPQIITGLFLGYIYKYLFFKNAAYVVIFAGICLFISMFLSHNTYSCDKSRAGKSTNNSGTSKVDKP
jgi:maltose/moltooligosaccharide transporter